MKQRVWTMVCIWMAMLTSTLLCVPFAMADESLPVDWYIDDMGVRDAWAQGITGKGVKVAVIDEQVVAGYPALSDANITYKAIGKNGAKTCETKKGEVMNLENPSLKAGERGLYSTHGTEMVAAIVGNGKGYGGTRGMYGVAPQATMFAYANSVSQPGEIGGSNAGDTCGLSDVDNINDAVNQGVRIISMSYGSPAFTAVYVEPLVNAMRHGVILVAARPNACVSSANDLVGEPLTNNIFPGEVTMNAVDRDGNLRSLSDCVDGNVSMLAPGDKVAGYVRTDNKTLPKYSYAGGGTSMATAIMSGYLALALQKWPKATGNQILQSLIRNTKGNDTGEPRLDPEHKRGFGEVDVTKLLSVDPTQYPDINPLLAWAYETSEKHEETRGMYTHHSDWGKDGKFAETDPFTTDGGSITIPREAELVGQEYERQQAAWKKVEQCKSDGGSDCMKYSATNTADETDGKTVLPDTGDGKNGVKSSSVPLWVWFAAGGVGLVVVIGGIVLAVVLPKRGRRRSRHGGHAAGSGPLPPVNPYPPQAPGVNNGMVPPPATGQYVPQQQAPYPMAFPQQAPYPAVPRPVPPQQTAQPPVMPGDTQNPYVNNNRNNR